MKWGKVDFRQLEKLQERINRMYEFDREKFCRDCAHELAVILYKKVVERTDVGDYEEISYIKKDGSVLVYNAEKQGGELRKSWTIKSVEKQGDVYICEVINPKEYASYYEYGHREEPGRFVPQIGKKLKNAWVEGKFILTISEKEIQSMAPGYLEMKLKTKLEDMVNGK